MKNRFMLCLLLCACCFLCACAAGSYAHRPTRLTREPVSREMVELLRCVRGGNS